MMNSTMYSVTANTMCGVRRLHSSLPFPHSITATRPAHNIQQLVTLALSRYFTYGHATLYAYNIIALHICLLFEEPSAVAALWASFLKIHIYYVFLLFFFITAPP